MSSRPETLLKDLSAMLARKDIAVIRAQRNAGRHWKLLVARGPAQCWCTVSCSPSDYRAARNAVATANRLLRQEEKACT